MFNTTPYNMLATYPNYPPHHEGLYLEEYFYQYYHEHKDEFPDDWVYIPVLWTNYRIHQGHQSSVDYKHTVTHIDDHHFNPSKEISKQLLDYLETNFNDPDKKYFTVAQSGLETQYIKPNYTVFAGDEESGNWMTLKGHIPVPLLCSPHKNMPEYPKEYLAGFVGTYNTHMIRRHLYSLYHNNPRFALDGRQGWSRDFTSGQKNAMTELIGKSVFSLCPRGAGKQSFRITESLELNSIPVYISNDFWLPYEDEVDWERLAVLIDFSEIGDLENKLLSYSDEDISDMLRYGKFIKDRYFSIPGVSTWIKEHLKKIK